MPRRDLSTVFLLRHAMPQVSADVAASRWLLNNAGQRAAVAIGARMPRDAELVCSAEQKAIRTLTLAAGVEPEAVRIDSRFGEVIRPGEPFDDAVAQRRRAWIEGRPDERHDGWETPREAVERFDAGLAAIDGARVVIASHGIIITAWLVACGVIPAGRQAGDFWSGLGFPDLIDVRQLMINMRSDG